MILSFKVLTCCLKHNETRLAKSKQCIVSCSEQTFSKQQQTIQTLHDIKLTRN